jgi:hypothetical protein
LRPAFNSAESARALPVPEALAFAPGLDFVGFMPELDFAGFVAMLGWIGFASGRDFGGAVRSIEGTWRLGPEALCFGVPPSFWLVPVAGFATEERFSGALPAARPLPPARPLRAAAPRRLLLRFCFARAFIVGSYRTG